MLSYFFKFLDAYKSEEEQKRLALMIDSEFIATIRTLTNNRFSLELYVITAAIPFIITAVLIRVPIIAEASIVDEAGNLSLTPLMHRLKMSTHFIQICISAFLL